MVTRFLFLLLAISLAFPAQAAPLNKEEEQYLTFVRKNDLKKAAFYVETGLVNPKKLSSGFPVILYMFDFYQTPKMTDVKIDKALTNIKYAEKISGAFPLAQIGTCPNFHTWFMQERGDDGACDANILMSACFYRSGSRVGFDQRKTALFDYILAKAPSLLTQKDQWGWSLPQICLLTKPDTSNLALINKSTKAGADFNRKMNVEHPAFHPKFRRFAKTYIGQEVYVADYVLYTYMNSNFTDFNAFLDRVKHNRPKLSQRFYDYLVYQRSARFNAYYAREFAKFTGVFARNGLKVSRDHVKFLAAKGNVTLARLLHEASKN